MSTQGLNNDNLTEHQVEFWLQLDALSYLNYYRGQVKSVQVISYCKKKVQFPASLLKSFVTHNGVKGRFVLRYWNTGKVVSLVKLSE